MEETGRGRSRSVRCRGPAMTHDNLPAEGIDPEQATGTSGAWFETWDGIRFCRENAPCRQVFYASDYQFDDIRRDDIVLDIGANVGAFCIRASRFSDHVVAVEPLTPVILARNILLNHCRISVLDLALGDGTPMDVAWDGLARTMPTATLESIIRLAGGCDFLKCDCEGAEWLIRPDHLARIRRIEMELHSPPLCGRPNPLLLDYVGKHYEIHIDRVPAHGPLGLMGYLHAKRMGPGL